jgi:transposase
MGTGNVRDAFKRHAVQQIMLRGCPVREVSRRIGVGLHSLCKWMKLFADPARGGAAVDHEAENRRQKQELARED